MKNAAKDYLMELILDLEEYVYERTEEGSELEEDLLDRISFIKEYLDKEDMQYVLKGDDVFCFCEGKPSECCQNRNEC
jgi:hypothetical protein